MLPRFRLHNVSCCARGDRLLVLTHPGALELHQRKSD